MLLPGLNHDFIRDAIRSKLCDVVLDIKERCRRNKVINREQQNTSCRYFKMAALYLTTITGSIAAFERNQTETSAVVLEIEECCRWNKVVDS